jgi:2-dehydro-3-deoxyphosphogluconate aldolase / (4S)-4-hydroxy-2-oxoglutarate aldolase
MVGEEPMTAEASNRYFDTAFSTQRYMAIFRHMSPEATVTACRRAWELGFDVVEVPIQTDDALPSLEAAVAAATGEGREIGAGTVTSIRQLHAARDLGAVYTVAPGVNPEVIDEALRLGIPHLPGVATASEITVAVNRGLRWLKAFPAAQLGSGWITAQLSGPFPDVEFVATGGMNAHNAREFLDAGVRAIGLGSAISDPEQLRLLPKD